MVISLLKNLLVVVPGLGGGPLVFNLSRQPSHGNAVITYRFDRTGIEGLPA